MSQSHDETIELGNGSSLTLPASFVEFEGLSEAKEWLRATLTFGSGEQVTVTFISPTRLRQDVDDELGSALFFFEPNLVVLRDVQRTTLIAVARDMSDLGPEYLRGEARI